MGRNGFTHEQIINKLREVEVLLGQGGTVREASRRIGVTEQTYYRWRKEYGGDLPRIIVPSEKLDLTEHKTAG